MRRLRTIAGDEQGIAVVMALVALLALTALVMAFLGISAFEPQISANLTAGTQARYLAEAGIEAAFDNLANTPDWDTALVGATCAVGALVPNTTANMAIPGLAVTSGTYTVRVRNDCNTGALGAGTTDLLLTGLGALDASATDDTNNRLVVTSIGTIGNATRTVKVVLRKVPLPPINGALSFPGVNADVDFSGSAFTIRGIDTAMGSETNDGTGPAVLGISVGVEANESTVDTALASNQQNSVTGRDQSVAGATNTGSNTVGFDTTLTSALVTNFVNAVKGAADISLTANGTDQSFSGVGGSCSTDINSPTCWGTTTHPKIVYVKGDGAGHGLDISGNSTGTGILIIENGTLDITGTFAWNGPIIVTGTGVKVRYHGGGNQSIWGSVIVNELSNDGSTNLEADIAGNAKIFYSTEAINTVLNGLGGRRFMSLYSWQEQ